MEELHSPRVTLWGLLLLPSVPASAGQTHSSPGALLTQGLAGSVGAPRAVAVIPSCALQEPLPPVPSSSSPFQSRHCCRHDTEPQNHRMLGRDPKASNSSPFATGRDRHQAPGAELATSKGRGRAALGTRRSAVLPVCCCRALCVAIKAGGQ